MTEPKKDARGEVMGEGNDDASRRYREGLEKGDAEALGKTAREDLQGTEGAALREAKPRGKDAETKGA